MTEKTVEIITSEVAEEVVAKNGKPKDVPIFNFHNLGLLDQLRFQEIQMELIEVQKVGQEVAQLATESPDTQISDDMIETLKLGRKLQGELVRIVSKVLRDVPESWLVDDAPDDIDWRKNDALNYISSDHLQDLTLAFGTAMRERFSPGN